MNHITEATDAIYPSKLLEALDYMLRNIVPSLLRYVYYGLGKVRPVASGSCSSARCRSL